MTLATSTVRALGALSAGLLTLGMLSACTPTPEPDPKPTKTALFASDEEAFKAAEETYRAYTDADNAHRRGEADDPQDFLTGMALKAYIDALRELDEAGLSLEGDVTVASFKGDPSSVKGGGERLSALVCLDISKTTAHSEAGAELPDRPPIVAQTVQMIWVDGTYLVNDEFEEDPARCGN